MSPNINSDLLLAILIGFLVGMLVAASFFSSWIGVACARTFAIATLGAGTGLLIWGILCSVEVAEFMLPFPNCPVRSPIESIAWGGGLLAASVGAMVFASLRITDD